jgi:hypothetical protein
MLLYGAVKTRRKLFCGKMRQLPQLEHKLNARDLGRNATRVVGRLLRTTRVIKAAQIPKLALMLWRKSCLEEKRNLQTCEKINSTVCEP